MTEMGLPRRGRDGFTEGRTGIERVVGGTRADDFESGAGGFYGGVVLSDGRVLETEDEEEFVGWLDEYGPEVVDSYESREAR